MNLHCCRWESQPYKSTKIHRTTTTYSPDRKWCQKSWVQCPNHCPNSPPSLLRSGRAQSWRSSPTMYDCSRRKFARSSSNPEFPRLNRDQRVSLCFLYNKVQVTYQKWWKSFWQLWWTACRSFSNGQPNMRPAPPWCTCQSRAATTVNRSANTRHIR